MRPCICFALLLKSKLMKPLVFVCLSLVVSAASARAASPVSVVNHGDSWRYHKGTNAPAPANWKIVDDSGLDPASWFAGNGGVGYANNGGVTAETNNCQTILDDMYNRYTTVQMRQQFTISQAAAPGQKLYLRMDWDDGFIAWLDGVYLMQRNSPNGTNEPAYAALASGDHESSLGNNAPNPAEIYDLGYATNWLGVGTHTLALFGLNGTTTSSDFIQVADLYLDTPPPPATNVWALASSPIVINTNVTIAATDVLVIEPGVSVQFGAGVRVVANGQVIAAGTPEKRIRLTCAGTSNWSGFSFSGNHRTNVFSYVDFEYANGLGNGGSAVVYINDSQVTFDHDTFLNISGNKYMDIWWPQVVIRHSVFGDVGASYMFTVENLAANGWFIVDGNLFGLNTGDNDIFHLNHISVKNGPKAIIVDNVFTGAGDDHIDDNESDSHIEGNLFMNFTTNHPPRSASCAVTTGEGSGVSTNLHTQHLTVVRNIFWGCDYGIINKDGSYVEVYNCIFVGNRGSIILDEPWRTDSGPGRACYVENSIFWNNWPENGTDQGAFAYLTNSSAYVAGRYYRGAAQVTVNNSILPAQYHYLGTGNLDGDPKFLWPTNLMTLSPTNLAFAGGFDGFDANEFLLTNHLIPDVHLSTGSISLGTGLNGSDMGIYVPDRAVIRGEPASPTTQTYASLAVSGLDIGGYKYRLLGPDFTNAWSKELQQFRYVPAITLSGTTAIVSSPQHGFTEGDLVEVLGADSLCPYYNGRFIIRNVSADGFSYTVDPGTNLLSSEPLSITWPIRNEGRTDIWCRKPQPIPLTGLSDGTYRVEVVRQNSMREWQDENSPTVSKTWTVMTRPLQLYANTTGANSVSLKFYGVAGQTYTLEYCDGLVPGNWQTLRHLPAPQANGDYTFNDEAIAVSTRFYRVTLP